MSFFFTKFRRERTCFVPGYIEALEGSAGIKPGTSDQLNLDILPCFEIFLFRERKRQRKENKANLSEGWLVQDY